MAYHPLAKKDSLVVLQGLLLLTAIIFTGVGAAQYQLTNLTQKKEQVAFFSLARDDNYRYSVYFLGSGSHFGRLYHLADVGQRDGRLIGQTAGYQFSIPVHLRFEIDIERIKSQLKTATVHFRRWAYAAKNYFEEELPIIIQYLPVFK